MRRPPFRTNTAAIVGAALLASLNLASGASAQERKTFHVKQEPPALVTVDIGAAGASHGDMLAFEAKIAADDGKSGVLRGILTTVDLPDASGDTLEDRVGQLVFDLGNGSMLVVSGASVYANQSVEMTARNAQIRAVTGGTGDFIGARGQVSTVRNDDGTYDHAFELLD